MKPINRAVRTFIQVFATGLIGTGVLSAIAADGVVDWSVVAKALISAAAGGIAAVIALAQNAAEDAGVIPALLKK